MSTWLSLIADRPEKRMLWCDCAPPDLNASFVCAACRSRMFVLDMDEIIASAVVHLVADIEGKSSAPVNEVLLKSVSQITFLWRSDCGESPDSSAPSTRDVLAGATEDRVG